MRVVDEGRVEQRLRLMVGRNRSVEAAAAVVERGCADLQLQHAEHVLAVECQRLGAIVKLGAIEHAIQQHGLRMERDRAIQRLSSRVDQRRSAVVPADNEFTGAIQLHARGAQSEGGEVGKRVRQQCSGAIRRVGLLSAGLQNSDAAAAAGESEEEQQRQSPAHPAERAQCIHAAAAICQCLESVEATTTGHAA